MEAGQEPLLIGMVFIKKKKRNNCTSRTLTNTENNTGRLAYVVPAERYEPLVPCFWQLLYRRKTYWQREKTGTKMLTCWQLAASKKVLNSLGEKREGNSLNIQESSVTMARRISPPFRFAVNATSEHLGRTVAVKRLLTSPEILLWRRK